MQPAVLITDSREKIWVQAVYTGVSVQAHSDGSHMSREIQHTVRSGAGSGMVRLIGILSSQLKRLKRRHYVLVRQKLRLTFLPTPMRSHRSADTTGAGGTIRNRHPARM